MPHIRSVALGLVVLAGCGARSGLEVSPAETLDAGRGVDAAAPIDAARSDAAVSRCPAPSRFGYELRALSTLSLGFRPGELSLAGDGTTVVLGVSPLGEGDGRLVELGRGGEITNESALLGMREVRVRVVAGRFVAVANVPDGRIARLVGAVGGYDVALASSPRGPLAPLARPALDGRSEVLAGGNGFEVFLGAFSGSELVTWRSFGPAFDIQAAGGPDDTVSLLYRGGDRALRVETFRDGVALDPISGVALEDVGFEGSVAFDTLEDGTSQPWVLAGFTNADGMRLTLRRFRVDGAAAGGFSTPTEGVMTADVDLSTIAPVGHRSGYGMVGGLLGPTGNVLFHGAGEDFVGDADTMPIACDGWHVSIASGPCGYVVACTNDDTISLGLAVPPSPR